jgi:hypothetical protein
LPLGRLPRDLLGASGRLLDVSCAVPRWLLGAFRLIPLPDALHESSSRIATSCLLLHMFFSTRLLVMSA